MQFHFYDIPFILVSFLFFLFAIFLFFNQKGKGSSNFLLGAFLLAIGLNTLDGFCLYRDIYYLFPNLAFWLNPVPALFGPLLFLYAKSVLYKDFQLQFRDIGHAWLFFVLFLVFLFTYHIHPKEHKLYYLEQAKTYIGPEVLLGSGILIVHIGIYMFLTLYHIRNYQKAVQQQFSGNEYQRISWLRFTVLGYGLVYIFSIFYTTARLTIWEGVFSLQAVLFTIFILFLFITGILFRALRHSEVFTEIEEAASKSPKYAYSRLSAEESQAHLKKLEAYMINQRPWLDPKLSLAELANHLSINAKILSQVINENCKQSFFDYVNSFRLNAAKELLKNPPEPKMTILEIMYEVGFNSKSSFNTAFKKMTGQTPSEFKNSFKK